MFEQAAFLQGAKVELPCHCKPDNIKSVIWFYKRHLSSKEIMLIKNFKNKLAVDTSSTVKEIDLLTRFHVVNFDLLIVPSHSDDSGIYICGSKTGEFFYAYELDIQSTTDARLIFGDKEENPLPEYNTNEFLAYTSFREWSPCDRCGVRGEQRKFGLCYVSSQYINPRYQIKGDDVSCGSDAVPKRFKPLIANRTAEIFIRSCKVPCYSNETLGGKVSNVVNDLATYLQGKFSFLPRRKLPTQNHIYALGDRVTLTCPGSKPEHAVAWDKDNERLYRSEYLIGTRKYMNRFIDHGNNLNIKFIEFTDKGLFTCWLNGKPVASFKLDVTKQPPRRRDLRDAETLFATRIIGFGFIFFIVLFVLIHIIKCWCYHCRCCPPKLDPQSEV
ncbi:hypothetical protein XENTR_v10020745 [Xenopus tropicalis]|nr:hypothetical protein XENTR_v10020745 [Xenopus tropicalis]